MVSNQQAPPSHGGANKKEKIMSVENAEYFPGDGKVIFGGVEIKLDEQPERTYVDGPWSYSNAAEGEEYIDGLKPAEREATAKNTPWNGVFASSRAKRGRTMTSRGMMTKTSTPLQNNNHKAPAPQRRGLFTGT